MSEPCEECACDPCLCGWPADGWHMPHNTTQEFGEPAEDESSGGERA